MVAAQAIGLGVGILIGGYIAHLLLPFIAGNLLGITVLGVWVAFLYWVFVYPVTKI